MKVTGKRPQISEAASTVKLFDPEFIERLKQGLKRSAEAATVLGELGWTVPMHFTPRETVEVASLGTVDDVDHFFEAYYTGGDFRRLRHLVEVVEGAEILDRWAPLIAEAHRAFEQIGHLVVIPALLTVVEGGFARLSNRLDSKIDVPRIARAQRDRFAKDTMTFALWNSVYVFVSNLFKPCSFRSEQRPALNRHWILHGRDYPEWTRADALRLFHALNTLVELGGPRAVGGGYLESAL